MGYFCLVPEDAIGDEHLTLAWYDTFESHWSPNAMVGWAHLVTHECPLVGHVFKLSAFGADEDIAVAEVALPHDFHLLRADFAGDYDQSEYDWNPHVTIVDGRTYLLGDKITFSRAEWRQ